MIRGIHHTSISTHQFDRLVAFYRDVIGIPLLFESTFEGAEMSAITGLPGATGRNAMLRAANLHIEIFEYATPASEPGEPDRPVNRPGLTHLCFDVVDIQAEYERLVAAGVRFHCPPQPLGRSILATYGRDPDGNVFELQEILTPKSRMAMTF